MPPLVDDGLLEVVGFKDAWHGLVLLSPKGHGTRLAQVCNFIPDHYLLYFPHPLPTCIAVRLRARPNSNASSTRQIEGKKTI